MLPQPWPAANDQYVLSSSFMALPLPPAGGCRCLPAGIDKSWHVRHDVVVVKNLCRCHSKRNRKCSRMLYVYETANDKPHDELVVISFSHRSPTVCLIERINGRIMVGDGYKEIFRRFDAIEYKYIVRINVRMYVSIYVWNGHFLPTKKHQF